jgi:arylformamidase
MAASDETAPAVRSILLLSGLFDLMPLSLLPVGRLLEISDPTAAEKLSPIRRRPRAGVKVGIAVGAVESEEFKWQSAEIAKRWQAEALETIAGTNHFDLLDGLRDGQLLDRACKIT